MPIADPTDRSFEKDKSGSRGIVGKAYGRGRRRKINEAESNFNIFKMRLSILVRIELHILHGNKPQLITDNYL